jgi:hypothetical protein
MHSIASLRTAVASAVVFTASGLACAAVTVTPLGFQGAGSESYLRVLSDDGAVAFGYARVTPPDAIATLGRIAHLTRWTEAGGHEDLGAARSTTPGPNYYY